MNLSPQKSKTIHDYRQHHGQADTEQTAPAEPAASPGCSRHQGLELGHPPNKWGLSLWIWGPEGCVVFTVSSHKFLMPPATLSSSWQLEKRGMERSVVAGVTLSVWGLCSQISVPG